ncbi:hypothetical protein KAK07_01495 [Ideonella sp. 4Y16]|uniref:hypothetical protein n=1 Tax=Ideonella alba TaxID=2824118 RepID=UPI001B3731AE|nr:hypothetical protein [Ideonella alba]MBQ0942000.1 hypothetical protein [Ideonella alba]
MGTQPPRPQARDTEPILADDEVPLDAATLNAFLQDMGTDMVLVGGQALAFWMDRYGVAPNAAAISNDGDALGSLERAQHIATSLRASLLTPDSDALTSLVAQIRIRTGSAGKVRNIDVLHLLFTVSGLRQSREFTQAVWRDSVEIEWTPGHRIRVMHPLHVLDSRVQNAVGLLESKGPHVVTQAIWAVDVAREAIRRVLRQPSENERLGSMIHQVHRLALSRGGRQILSQHGIEVLDAVPTDEIRAAAPVHEPQLRAIEKAIAARSAATT